jgi:hypothetical protein
MQPNNDTILYNHLKLGKQFAEVIHAQVEMSGDRFRGQG